MGWLVLALMALCVVGQVAVYAWMIHDIESNRARTRKELAEIDARIKALRLPPRSGNNAAKRLT